MTARAIGVFALVLAVASPAMAGPSNSVIGGKKLEQDMVHNAGTGFPSTFYEWWNQGNNKLDWGLAAELVYGDWGAATTAGTRGNSRLVRIGLAIDGILRWNLSNKERPKVTNSVGFLLKPGILFSGNTGSTFTFGFKIEAAAPVSIDVHERVDVIVGGAIPFTYFVNSDFSNVALIPLLIRMGVEIKANDKISPWFFFDLGPGILVGGGSSTTAFAWRIGAGTSFWGVLKKNRTSRPAETTQSMDFEEEPMSAEPIE